MTYITNIKKKKKKKKKKHFTSVFQARLGLLDGIFNAISYMFAAATCQEASPPWEKLALWPTPPKFTHSQCHNTYVTQHVYA